MHVFICPNIIFKILFTIKFIKIFNVFYSKQKTVGYNVWFWHECRYSDTGIIHKSFKVHDWKFSLIVTNLSFFKTLKNTSTMFLKLHPQYFNCLPLLTFYWFLSCLSYSHSLIMRHCIPAHPNIHNMKYRIARKCDVTLLKIFTVSSFKFSSGFFFFFFSLVCFKNSTDPIFQVTDVALFCETEVSG